MAAAVDSVLFDFDGPLCRLFAGHPAYKVADVLKERMRQYGPLTAVVESCDDPHALLVMVAGKPTEYAAGLSDELDATLAKEEVVAAGSAVITPGVDTLVKSLHERGTRLGVVTNNSEESARLFLLGAGLLDAFDGPIIGRPRDALLMKPHGYMLRSALDELGTSSERCLFVGDSWRDVHAARSAEIPFVGYARDRRKSDELASAGAATLISHMADMESLVW
ncbi:HAD family hydrolase [Streptomyces sp. NPDC088733]|uniref:HAD family hydrolase n=1 Tax=Streptomyces sp. NPDC088733 TaxID=3365880 RepID=UPI0038059C70